MAIEFLRVYSYWKCNLSVRLFIGWLVFRVSRSVCHIFKKEVTLPSVFFRALVKEIILGRLVIRSVANLE